MEIIFEKAEGGMMVMVGGSKSKKVILASLIGGLLFASCNIKKIAVVTTAETTAEFSPLIQRYDIPFVLGSGIASNILIMETALMLDPNNTVILEALAEAYCSWGFAFVEDEDREKASILYRKGYMHAEKGLSLRNKKFAEVLKLLKENKAQFEDLAKTISKDDIKLAFWYTSCLAYWISASGGTPETVAEISKLLAFMDRLIELDEGYYYGTPLILRASFYATAPSILGGSPTKSKIFFSRAFRKSDGKFLLAYVPYAQFYATLLKDRTEKEVYQEEVERLREKIEGYKSTIEEVEDEGVRQKLQEQVKKLEEEYKQISSPEVSALFTEKTGEQIFDEMIQYILETDSGSIPEAKLPNEIAKEKARRLLKMKAELF